jgi:hypothetical protein
MTTNEGERVTPDDGSALAQLETLMDAVLFLNEPDNVTRAGAMYRKLGEVAAQLAEATARAERAEQALLVERASTLPSKLHAEREALCAAFRADVATAQEEGRREAVDFVRDLRRLAEADATASPAHVQGRLAALDLVLEHLGHRSVRSPSPAAPSPEGAEPVPVDYGHGERCCCGSCSARAERDAAAFVVPCSECEVEPATHRYGDVAACDACGDPSKPGAERIAPAAAPLGAGPGDGEQVPPGCAFAQSAGGWFVTDRRGRVVSEAPTRERAAAQAWYEFEAFVSRTLWERKRVTPPPQGEAAGQPDDELAAVWAGLTSEERDAVLVLPAWCAGPPRVREALATKRLHTDASLDAQHAPLGQRLVAWVVRQPTSPQAWEALMEQGVVPTPASPHQGSDERRDDTGGELVHHRESIGRGIACRTPERGVFWTSDRSDDVTCPGCRAAIGLAEPHQGSGTAEPPCEACDDEGGRWDPEAPDQWHRCRTCSEPAPTPPGGPSEDDERAKAQTIVDEFVLSGVAVHDGPTVTEAMRTLKRIEAKGGPSHG